MALCDHWILCFLLVSSRRKMESISLFLQFDWANLDEENDLKLVSLVEDSGFEVHYI